MIKPPCKDCERREVGCHGRCEAFQVFEAAKQEEYARRAEQNNLNRYSNEKESALRRSVIKKARRAGK